MAKPLTLEQWSSIMSLQCHEEEYVLHSEYPKIILHAAECTSRWTGVNFKPVLSVFCHVSGPYLDHKTFWARMRVYTKLIQPNFMFMAYVKHPERIGVGLDVFSSSINHSCAPNAHYFFGGRELRVRSLRSIRPNEEIQKSYMKNTYYYVFRQHRLRS